jgi:hypothetical protein
MKVHLTIWDQQGNQLYHGQVPSCFDSLRPDDAFWIGEPQTRQWVKVARMTYGVCTKDGSVYLEIVVEGSEQKPTRDTRSTPQTVDHGQIRLPFDGGDVRLKKASGFSLSVGGAGFDGECVVRHLTIRYSKEGVEDARSFTQVKIGETKFLKAGGAKLDVTLLQAEEEGDDDEGIVLQATEERRT